ncbi:hypothetical protein SZ25_00058 [Candidatus Arcanobacter lacustris]|uniref:Uncharacterized protein n=1 Tax=Candidatus Arcanibacter lacustris TaxID=1607817 RepID=A0A0F5MS26_9RICK|nr:hypothetical protein SZ25_00058 [Candidatus Arcanobacter lacustris]
MKHTSKKQNTPTPRENNNNDNHHVVQHSSCLPGFMNSLRALLPFIFTTAEIVEDIVVDAIVPNQAAREEITGEIHEANNALEALITAGTNLAENNIVNTRIPNEEHPNIEAISQEVRSGVDIAIDFASTIATTVALAELDQHHLPSSLANPTASSINQMADVVKKGANIAIDGLTDVTEYMEETEEGIMENIGNIMVLADNNDYEEDGDYDIGNGDGIININPYSTAAAILGIVLSYSIAHHGGCNIS